MVGKIKSFELLKGYGIITTLTGEELPVQARNVNMNGAVVLNKNDVVEYELGTDESGKPQAVNVSVIQKVEYAVKLSKLTFKDFGLDIKNNILNPPKSNCDEYCLVKLENTKEVQDYITYLVCENDKQPCGVAVFRKNNQVLISYSDTEKPTDICRFQNYGIKDAPKDQQYLAVGELLTKTYKLENYGIMVELEDSFYQAIME